MTNPDGNRRPATEKEPHMHKTLTALIATVAILMGAGAATASPEILLAVPEEPRLSIIDPCATVHDVVVPDDSDLFTYTAEYAASTLNSRAFVTVTAWPEPNVETVTDGGSYDLWASGRATTTIDARRTPSPSC